MSGIKAVLVDLDGTLVDTAPANYLAYAQALRAVGVEVERARFDRIAAGRNWRQFLPPLLEASCASGEAAAVAADKARLYPALLTHSVLNQPLAALIQAGKPVWRTALVTTASAANAAAVLRHHGIDTLFDVIVTGSDVARHKPDPQAYWIAAERLGVEPSECLVFEDSDIGMAAGKAFGAPCIRIAFAAGSTAGEADAVAGRLHAGLH